ncbi:hypothetical protein PSEUDO9AZ_20999 [Pseudomonas sp. 9AZ]|nr:hypothetical protein PSEUDO9AZ_20999 [Pseudomonas sp. 9AZ]
MRSSTRLKVPASKRSHSGSSNVQCSARARSTRLGSIIGASAPRAFRKKRRLYCKPQPRLECQSSSVRAARADVTQGVAMGNSLAAVCDEFLGISRLWVGTFKQRGFYSANQGVEPSGLVSIKRKGSRHASHFAFCQDCLCSHVQCAAECYCPWGNG